MGRRKARDCGGSFGRKSQEIVVIIVKHEGHETIKPNPEQTIAASVQKNAEEIRQAEQSVAREWKPGM